MVDDCVNKEIQTHIFGDIKVLTEPSNEKKTASEDKVIPNSEEIKKFIYDQ